MLSGADRKGNEMSAVLEEMRRLADEIVESSKQQARAYLKEHPEMIPDMQRLDHSTMVVCVRVLFDQGMPEAASVIMRTDILVRVAQEMPKSEGGEVVQ